MTYAVPKVTAEIGCAHLGSMDRARMLISLAADCGVDFVKFQKRNPDECVPEDLKNKPHPNQIFSYGETYLDHRKALELNLNQHFELKKYCDMLQVKYACSVWDMTSAKEIIEVNPAYIKIPSACNNNCDLIRYVMQNYQGDLHVSTGMTSNEDILKLLQLLMNWPNRVVIYHCTSIYPCPFEKLHLLQIEEYYSVKRCGVRIGFSNHGYGIAADVAAYVLGAEYIERHFVDDRTLRHSDAAASLEPEGMRKLCRDLYNVHQSLTYKNELTAEEIAQETKMRIK
jgi:N-acetylneuraminate synthase